MFGTLVRWLGPVFAADFVALGRRPRTWALRIAVAAVMLGVFVLAFGEMPAASRGGSIKTLARQAEDVARLVLTVQWLAAWFVGPGLVLGGMAGDRLRANRDVLFATALANREIVLGTVGARLLAAALLLAVPMPCLAIMATMGGVSIDELALSQVEILVVLAFSAGMALFFAARRRTALEAAALTLLACVATAFLVPFAAFLVVQAKAAGFPGPWFWRLRYFCPGYDTVLDWMAGRRGPGGRDLRQFVANTLAGMDGPWHQWIAWGCQAAALPLGAWFAIRTLRRPLPARKGGMVTRALRRLQAPGIGGTRRSRAGVSNPWWQRARVARVYDRGGMGRTLALLFAGAAGLGLAAHSSSDRWNPLSESMLPWATAAWFAGCATLVAVAAVGPVGDRKRGFLGDALLTDMTMRQHFDGMLLAVWEHVRVPAFGLLVVYSAHFFLDLRIYDPDQRLRLALSIPLLVSLGLATVVGTVAIALAARTAAQALGACLLLAALTMFVVFWIGLLGLEAAERAELFPAGAMLRAFPPYPLFLVLSALVVGWGGLGRTLARAMLALAALVALVFLALQLVVPVFTPLVTLLGLWDGMRHVGDRRAEALWGAHRTAIVLWQSAALLVLALLTRELAVRRFERIVRRTD